MLIHTRLEGSYLAGNLLGDPSERDLFVYLPPGYEESHHRYPTAHLLQAYGTTAAEMVTPATDSQRWSPPLEDVLDPVFGGIDAGSNDEYNLHWGHRLLSHYLDQAGIAHEHRENPGNHGGRADERYQVALQWLSDVLAGD